MRDKIETELSKFMEIGTKKGSLNEEASKDDITGSCELCVALNKTVFKNNNKPEYYHINCRCSI